VAEGSRNAGMRELVRGVFRARSRETLLTLNLLRQHWPGVVGPELGARTHPQRLEGSVLWIAAPDASWAYELQFFKAELLSSVQAFLESRAVSDLRFRVGEVPARAATGAAETPAAADALDAPAAPEAPDAPQSPAAPGDPPSAGAAGSAAAAQPGTPRRGAAQDAPEAPPALARAAASIGDAALREVFQRSLAKQERGRRQRQARPAGPAGDER
jgi:Dna[CI] antecedent, DciA